MGIRYYVAFAVEELRMAAAQVIARASQRAVAYLMRSPRASDEMLADFDFDHARSDVVLNISQQEAEELRRGIGEILNADRPAQTTANVVAPRWEEPLVGSVEWRRQQQAKAR